MKEKNFTRGIKTRMRTLFVLEYLNRHAGRVVSAAAIMEEFLLEHTLDYKNNSVSMNKYIYEDIRALQEFGYDVEIMRGKGIRLKSRTDGLTQTEIDLIETAIRMSPILMERDKKALCYKLTGKFSDLVYGMSMPESIELIKKAIGDVDEEECPCSPRYVSFDYTLQEKTFDETIAPAMISKEKVVPYKWKLPTSEEPFAWIWGISVEHRIVSKYRVDRINNLKISEKCEASIIKEILQKDRKDTEKLVEEYK